MNCERPMFEFNRAVHDRAVEALQAELRRAIDERRFSYETLQAATGISDRTIRSYTRTSCPAEPSLSNALALLCVLGAGAFSRVLNVVGYSAIAHDEPEPVCISQVTAHILEPLKDVAFIGADKTVRPQERRPLRMAADRIMAVILPWTSAAKAV